MSGLFLSWQGGEEAFRGERLHFAPRAYSTKLDWAPWQGVLTRIEAGDKRWLPAHDEASGLVVAVVGRLAWEISTWEEAERCRFSGGSAARLLLARWQDADRQTFLDLIDGVASVLVLDRRQQTLHLFTDRLGLVPLFIAGRREPVLCTHPDVLADWELQRGRPVTLDATTLAEGIATATGVPPYTYYKEILGLDAGMHYQFCWNADSVEIRKTPYWTASETFRNASKMEWVERICAALQGAVARRTHDLAGKVAVFLSGGADSRAFLYAAREPERLLTFTCADTRNPESEIAARVAASAGSPNHLLLRDYDHYGTSARESVRITGGYWSIKDNHFHGFLPVLEQHGIQALLTGDYADYLLKGLALNTRQVSIGGRKWPIEQLAPFSFEFYQPHSPIAPTWKKRVLARLEAHFPAELRHQPHLMEDRRLRPLWRESDGLCDVWLQRMTPWDPPFSDNALIDLYDQLPPEYKLNGHVFRLAVQRLASPAQKRIPDNNYGGPVDASPLAVMAYASLRRQRTRLERLWGKLAGHKTPGLATIGSWPNFALYVRHSKLVASLWSSPSPHTRECLTDILGHDPWHTDMAHWGRSDDTLQLFLRLLTIKLWLDGRGY